LVVFISHQQLFGVQFADQERQSTPVERSWSPRSTHIKFKVLLCSSDRKSSAQCDLLSNITLLRPQERLRVLRLRAGVRRFGADVHNECVVLVQMCIICISALHMDRWQIRSNTCETDPNNRAVTY